MGLRWQHRFLILCGLGLAVAIAFEWHPPLISPAPATSIAQSAPPLRKHALPASLATWQDAEQRGDYFDQIKPSKVGYLLWSQFPIQVYVGPATATSPQIAQAWQPAVRAGIQDWQPYLPLAITDDAQTADIAIAQQMPGRDRQARVRSAETRYRIYIDPQNHLKHRIEINIRPNQTSPYITAAVRHELGHALGLWGHSPNPQDVLYFSQVRQPPPISTRDINTLKRVYEQPTRLGWPLPHDEDLSSDFNPKP